MKEQLIVNNSSEKQEEELSVDKEKDTVFENAKDLLMKNVRNRHEMVKKILSNKKEDGSIMIDDLVLNEGESEQLLYDSNSLMDGIQGEVEKLKNASEEELTGLIEDLKKEEVSEKNVTNDIKEKITAKRAEEEVRNHKQEIEGCIKETENIIMNKSSEFIESGDLKKAVQLREVREKMNLLAMESSYISTGSVNKRGLEGINDHTKIISEIKEKINDVSFKINSIINEVSVEADSDIFNTNLGKCNALVEEMKQEFKKVKEN